MGVDYTEHGTNGLVLHVPSGTATGSVTVTIVSETLLAGESRHMFSQIGIRVAAYAGWGGTVKVAQCYGSGDATGGEAAAIQLADLEACIDGTTGAVDLPFWGPTKLMFEVSNNDRDVDIFVTSMWKAC